MTQVRRGILWGIGMLLSAALAHGQQAGPSGDRKGTVEQFLDRENGLTLSDAIKSALEREPAIRAARTEIDAARGMRVQAGLRPNPMFSLEQREQPDGDDNQTMVGVEWPLDLFRRTPRVAAADREVEAVQYSVADRVRLQVAEVRLKYGEAATAIRALAVADELAISGERNLTLRRARVDEGASPPLERDLLDVEFRRREAERLVAEGMAQAAMIELRRVLGLRPESALRLRDTIDTLVPKLTLAPSSPSMAMRPDVREAEVRVRLADARINLAGAEGRFDMSLFGAYMRMASSFPQLGFNAGGTLEPVHGAFRYLIGGTTMTVPLWNRNQGEMAAARADREGAEARLEATRLAAEAEVASALAQDARARQALQVIESAVRLSRQNVDVMRQTYELGRATTSEVLAEQRRHLELENAYTESLKRTYDGRVLLLRAQGELP